MICYVIMIADTICDVVMNADVVCYDVMNADSICYVFIKRRCIVPSCDRGDTCIRIVFTLCPGHSALNYIDNIIGSP